MNDLFYEMEGRQIQKMNKVLADVELTKAEEKNSDMACRMGRKYRRLSDVSHRKNSPDTGRSKRADMPINISVSPISNRIVLNKNKPSAFESEIHPSHKLRLCSAYFALAGGKLPTGG